MTATGHDEASEQSIPPANIDPTARHGPARLLGPHLRSLTAHIHDRIIELPCGYETVIGEEVRLSGGEAQRITIARALAADTPVLVLDEATAFADPQTDRAVRQNLATLRDRTVLVIAHRLETIADADTVVMLEDIVLDDDLNVVRVMRVGSWVE